jgi:peptidoglycan/xylan/chitin deacetylase (PgdA/CDA1 family)/ketosteroid isomerase-like protein
MTAALLVLAATLLGTEAPRPVLVTVDDLPMTRGLHPDSAERRRITEGLLAALARHRIRAVGFVTWSNVTQASDEALLKAWLAAGHELGNHSDRHLDLTNTALADWLADVERARLRLAAFLDERGGPPLRFFRFPYLREGETEAKLDAARHWLARTRQRNLTVTIDNQDAAHERPFVEARRAANPAAMAQVAEEYHTALRLMVRHHERNGDRLLGRTSPQVLLLHANEVGAENWDRLFTWLEQTGHRFVSADELLADPAFDDLPRVPATRGVSLWDRIDVVRREAEAREGVGRLLSAQAAAWTRGDLDAFCSAYAADATFVSPSGLAQGRQAVLDRYRSRYKDRAAMGALTLEILEARPVWGMETSLLDDAVPGRVHAVSVVARWTLKREGMADAAGLTLLVLRLGAAGWQIIQDASMELLASSVAVDLGNLVGGPTLRSSLEGKRA